MYTPHSKSSSLKSSSVSINPIFGSILGHHLRRLYCVRYYGELTKHERKVMKEGYIVNRFNITSLSFISYPSYTYS